MAALIAFILANKASLIMGIPFLTRAYYSLKNGGGLVGVWNSIMYGTNAPKQK
jgi:hypothetical protein